MSDWEPPPDPRVPYNPNGDGGGWVIWLIIAYGAIALGVSTWAIVVSWP